jgi:hypothetical protein
MQELFFELTLARKTENSGRQQPAAWNEEPRAASLRETINLVAAYIDNTAMGSRQSGKKNKELHLCGIFNLANNSSLYAHI